MLRTLLATLAVAGVVAAPTAALGQERPPDKQPTADGGGGAVATVDAYATDAALDVLRGGGNAVDAAVAAAAVLGVTEPYSCGIGGGGFMVVREANGRITTIDGREKAPRAMTPTSFLGPDGKPIPFDQAVTSGLGVGVPGTVKQWETALRRFGTIDLAEALAPGERLARAGFVVDQTFFDQTQNNLGRLGDFTASARIFLDADGTPRDVGKRLRNRDLARTYRLLGRNGSRAFYEGAIADAIVRTVKAPPLREGSARVVRPGLMETRDLERYTAPEREPAISEFRGVRLYGMQPPSSGGSTVAEILNIIESGDWQFADRDDALHRFLEAGKLAFADRNQYIGDPAYVDVPLRGLLSQRFADERARRITDTAARTPVAPGDPSPFDGERTPSAHVERSQSTTHLTTADSDGRMVSYTFTIESTGGSGITVPGYGFLLNNELTDFNLDGKGANAPAGGKRPRSSMAPTIAERDGRPFLALGSPGGATIITTVAQVLFERIDLGRPLPAAVAAPRLSQRNAATTQVEPGFETAPEFGALAGRGHRLAVSTTPGGAEIGAVTGVEVRSGGRLRAVAEATRRGGGAAGVVRPSGR